MYDFLINVIQNSHFRSWSVITFQNLFSIMFSKAQGHPSWWHELVVLAPMMVWICPLYIGPLIVSWKGMMWKKVSYKLVSTTKKCTGSIIMNVEQLILTGFIWSNFSVFIMKYTYNLISITLVVQKFGIINLFMKMSSRFLIRTVVYINYFFFLSVFVIQVNSIVGITMEYSK